MKKIAFVICLAIVVTMSSCNYSESYQDAYDSGYACGYDDGWVDGATDSDLQWFSYVDDVRAEEYDSGFSEGYRAGFNSFAWLAEDDAVDYAKSHGGWHPEEAWMIIEAYQNNAPFYSDDSLPSEQDYLDAIQSLIFFYDYFYSAKYE